MVYSALFEASREALRTLARDHEVRGHGSAGVLRRAAHVGSESGVSPACALRGAGRRGERGGGSVDAVACSFLRAR